MALITSQELQVTYVTFFARPADKSGYEYWVQQEKDAALAAISSSDEAKLMYAGKGEASAIDQIYQNLLGRDSDPDGNFYWASQLQRDADGNFINLADVALQIATAAIDNPNKNPDGKLDSLAIQYKIDAAEQFTAGLYSNPTAAVNYQQNQQAGKDLLKGIGADSTPATVEAAVAAAITTAAQGGTSGEGTEFTFSNVASATLNDNTNIGFTPEKAYLADANDKIIVESFDSFKDVTSVTIQDPSVKDADILTIALSAQNTTNGAATFGKTGVTIKNIETIHINTTGDVKTISNNATIDGLKVLEIAGDTVNLTVNGDFGAGKVDASGITVGNVILTAGNATELVGGAGNDELYIGKEGGTLTGNSGKDTFFVKDAVNNLVTITDISTGDKVNFGASIITDGTKASELTVAGSSDETTFIANLQKAANTQAANGLYYAEYNGNTYVVANGNISGQALKGLADLAVTGDLTVSSASGTVATSAASSISASSAAPITVNGSIKLTGASVSYSSGAISSVSASFSSTSVKLTGAYSGDATLTAGTVSASAATITGITIDGKKYNASEFTITSISSVSGTSITFDTLSFSAGTVSDTAFSSGAGTAKLTGINDVNFDGMLVGDLTAGTKDDIIIKLAGSHNLATEAAAVSAGELAFI